jgi:DNA-binding SARP family transcriptional activator
MLSVRMLGVMTISVDGRRIADDLGPSGRTLTAFLFESLGEVHRRERLADQFWGHLDPERARAALSTALWRFRKLLARDAHSKGGENLRTNGSDVILEQAPWLHIDTLRFDAATKGLLGRLDLDPDTFVSELKETIDSYTGPFLDGEDADWILVERERLHSLFIRGATELVRHCGKLGLYEEAAAVARRILAVDPFRESIHRDLLILLLLNGQRGDALRHHKRWTTRLHEELGIGPMPQTARLVDDIRSGKIFDRVEIVKTEHFATPAGPRLAFSAGRQMPGRAPDARSAELVFESRNSAADQ